VTKSGDAWFVILVCLLLVFSGYMMGAKKEKTSIECQWVAEMLRKGK
jgi:hypothetical protein